MLNTVINQASGQGWHIYNGDCCEVIRGVPDESIHYSVYSPPFKDLMAYSPVDRDMGNCETDEDFFEHYKYLLRDMLRVLKPGRLMSIHCMNLPSTKGRDGFIGIKDFRGQIIRACQEVGFIYHSEVCIWKNPVVAMQRTKALGLLHKQIKKDSCRSRQGIADYVCTFGKPGDNPEPVAGEFDHWCGDESFRNEGNFSIDVWQRYASPVWTDIDQSRTLNGRMAKEDKDQRHICPIQLDVVHRCVQMWTNPGDTVLTPFMGIGSECYESILMGRNAIGIELKESYFNVACDFLRQAEDKANEGSLFDGIEE